MLGVRKTPSEPAHSLSYQDMLELKAIQRTLPRANQLPDMYTGKPASQFLSKVPIGLLPSASNELTTTYHHPAIRRADLVFSPINEEICIFAITRNSAVVFTSYTTTYCQHRPCAIFPLLR
ncbi:hypothetical protein EV421DRAFT_1799239 [Armillaria borealis]|uniref:Uncharacterized protein n=1 Tax=Armillaria borealis TaxID=47425 RepID=A0AA39MS89_9AGAR|nr:hypothetical protein EV421DRAFT_1799239 [Armillaria borealis]